jgi:hypothetical protein
MRYSAPGVGDQGEKAHDQRGLQRSGNFIFPWSSQRSFGKMAIAKTIDLIGAGERNRTAVISLEGIGVSRDTKAYSDIYKLLDHFETKPLIGAVRISARTASAVLQDANGSSDWRLPDD